MKNSTVKEYLLSYHDEDGMCFDEDIFYSVDTLIDNLIHAKKSHGGLKVWACLSDG